MAKGDETDVVFRALNDPSRRLLLDRLFDHDGQTLSQLCQHLPDMTRFGVMNHLKILGQVGLVTSARAGREKYHYLNPIPIQELHDRWIDKFTAPMVGALTDLKRQLEHRRGVPAMTEPNDDGTGSKPTHVYETYVRCRPSQAWTALTDGDQTVRYYYGTRVESDWSDGGTIRYLAPDGSVVADGRIVTAIEPSRLEMDFHPRWDAELEAEGAVRMVWLVTEADGPPEAELTRVRVEYHDLDPASATYRDFTAGIPFIVAGLKTLLETGSPLAAPA